MIAEANEIRENERLRQLNQEDNDDHDGDSVRYKGPRLKL